MPAHITESDNYKSLEKNYPKLKTDKEHRRKFHDYLADMEKTDQKKPTAYQELEQAYKDFAGIG